MATSHTILTAHRQYAAIASLALLAGSLVALAPAARAQAPAPAATTSATSEVPVELNAYALTWIAKGSGALRFFGFKAYDATLWVPASQPGFSLSRSFALDIRYNTTVKASDIVNTSLIEMTRIASATPEQVKAWTAFMTQLFVDVKSGDRLVGVRLPDKGSRFFLNGKLLGETADEAFSDAFFRIWLDPKTRRPELRDALLGTAAAPAPAPTRAP